MNYFRLQFTPIIWTLLLLVATSLFPGIAMLHGQIINLPAPVEWEPSEEMPPAPGSQLTAEFSEDPINPDAPVIGEWNRTALPGESFTLSGTRFTLEEGDAVGSDTRVYLYFEDSEGGQLLELELWQVTDQIIMCSLPDDLPFEVYLVWVENAAGASAPVILNRAQAEWIGPLGHQAAQNTTKRVFGKDLSTHRGETTSHVFIRPAGATTAPVACTVTNAEPFAVSFVVPSLAPGDYEIFVHNGHGGRLGWSAPQPIKVILPFNRGSDEILIEDTTSGDRTSEIQAAIDTLTALPNGGTVRLGPGTFRIASTLTLKKKVSLTGSGREDTTLLLQRYGGRNLAFAVAANHIALEEMTVRVDEGKAVNVSSSSFSNSNYNNYNEDVLIKNVNFLVSTDTTSSLSVALQAKRLEVTGCFFEAPLSGAPVDWWIHDNVMHGGRSARDGAMGFRSDHSYFTGRIVLENCHAETPDWPHTNGVPDNFNGMHQGRTWCSRFFHMSPHRGSIEHSYIAHNTGQNVAINENKGEIMLFHSSDSGLYGQVDSNSGRTLTIRTDGTIDGDANFRLWKNSSAIFYPMTAVPSKVGLGTRLADVAFVTLVNGTGKGQVRRIEASTSTTITVTEDWRIPPDETTKFVLSHLYLGHLIYKNEFAAVPPGWVDTGHIASYHINFDGNTVFSAADSNSSLRTYYSDAIQGYLTGPAYWNEIRNSNNTEAYRNGSRINLRGGDWGSGASEVITLGPLALGNWIRGGSNNASIGIQAIIEGWGSLPANELFIEGSGLEGIATGSTMSAASYANVLLRRNIAFGGASPAVSLQNYSEPVLIENETFGYSGSTPINDYAELPILPIRFVDLQASEASAVINVANGGWQDMTWSALAADPWIDVSPVPGTNFVASQDTSGQLQISIDPALAPVGLSLSHVTIQSGSKTAVLGLLFDNTIYAWIQYLFPVSDPGFNSGESLTNHGTVLSDGVVVTHSGIANPLNASQVHTDSNIIASSQPTKNGVFRGSISVADFGGANLAQNNGLTLAFWFNPQIDWMYGDLYRTYALTLLAYSHADKDMRTMLRYGKQNGPSGHRLVHSAKNYIIPDSWQHYTIVIPAGAPMRYYRNGTLFSVGGILLETDDLVSTSDHTFKVGGHGTSSSLFDNELEFANYQLFRGELSDAEVLTLFNSQFE